MTTAGLYRPAPGSVPPPAAGTRRDRAAAGWRMARLYLVSRRVPMALALLAGLGALLWSALQWHWNIAGGAAAQLFIPLTIQTGAAAVIAVTTYGPFGGVRLPKDIELTSRCGACQPRCEEAVIIIGIDPNRSLRGIVAMICRSAPHGADRRRTRAADGAGKQHDADVG